jgi:hypothetical protein
MDMYQCKPGEKPNEWSGGCEKENPPWKLWPPPGWGKKCPKDDSWGTKNENWGCEHQWTDETKPKPKAEPKAEPKGKCQVRAGGPPVVAGKDGVQAIGSGFAPNSTVTVDWGGLSGTVTLPTNAQGQVVAFLATVPQSTDPGSHTVKFQGHDGTSCSGSFTVTSGH